MSPSTYVVRAEASEGRPKRQDPVSTSARRGPADGPAGRGGRDRSDRNGPGYVDPDLGLVNPSRGPAAGLAELAGGRVPGTATRSPVARRGATTPPDGKFGAPLPASSAASADPACAPRDRPHTLCHVLVAQGSCAQIDKTAAGPTYSAGGGRAQAAALQVSQVTFNGPRAAASARARGRPAAPCGRRGVGVAVAATNRATSLTGCRRLASAVATPPPDQLSDGRPDHRRPSPHPPRTVHPGVHPGVADDAGERAGPRSTPAPWAASAPPRRRTRKARCRVPRRERRRVRHRHLAERQAPAPTRGRAASRRAASFEARA